MANPFSRIRSAAIDGRLLNPYYKQTQLKKIHDALSSNAVQIQRAMSEDTGNRAVEVKLEFWLSLKALADQFVAVDPEKALKEEYAIAQGKDAPRGIEAVGIVVVEPASHAFLYCLVSALAPAIAAGNAVVVQTGNSMQKTPSLVLGLIQTALDRDIFQVCHAEVKESELNHRHLRVLQRGSSAPSLAHHLVSDLEARVVAIVERDADIEAAANAVATARFSLGGKSPYGPDVVLVNEWVKNDFLFAVAKSVVRIIADSNAPQKSPKGLKSKLAERAADEGLTTIISATPNGAILDVKTRTSFLLNEKIREACLVVTSVTSMDDAIDISKSHGRLAATYIFAKQTDAKYIAQFTDSNLSLVNHFPPSLLFAPIAPLNSPLGAGEDVPYQPQFFTLAKQQFIQPSSLTKRLGNILTEANSTEIQKLIKVEQLPPVKRLKDKSGPGFFEQGILTGAVLFLSVAVACSGALGYVAFKMARGRLL